MTIIKKFTYRGSPEEWSNQYWLTGSTPADDTAWLALFNALATEEKTLYGSGHSIVRAYGYTSAAPGATAAYTRDLEPSLSTIPGTLALNTASTVAPGDAAVWIRWKTSRVTSPGGKAIYLRKYYHGVQLAEDASSNNDALTANQITALTAFAAKMWDGSFLDARKITSAGTTDTILGAGISPYVTTRTLKRRGKRPGS